MVTNPKLILLFAICFAFFMLAPSFLGQPFPFYPLMHWTEVLDLLTPLILIPLYWLLFTDQGRLNRPLNLVIAFLVIASLWSLGHGIHLAANSISGILGLGATPVHELAHFYDEVLSHYLWHIAVVAFSVLLLWPLSSGETQSDPVAWAIIIPSMVLYGFTYFAVIVEGGTVPFGLTAAALIVLILLIKERTLIRSNDLTAFFFFGYVFSLLLFAVWFVYWGGFPQFSEVGLI